MSSLTKLNLIKLRGLGLAVIAATAALFTLFATSPAYATLTLVQDYAIQQTNNDPCVIGNNSCTGSVIPYYSPTGKPPTTYDFYSPNYVASSSGLASPNYIPTAFTLGIDTNLATSAGNEELLFWDTYVCSGTCATNTSGGGSASGILSGFTLDTANSWQTPTYIDNYKNGNGFSDALLKGFSLTADSTYYFEVGMANVTDGMEQFFIIPGANPPPNVPEPGSLGIFGTGLIGLGLLGFFANRRRRA